MDYVCLLCSYRIGDLYVSLTQSGDVSSVEEFVEPISDHSSVERLVAFARVLNQLVIRRGQFLFDELVLFPLYLLCYVSDCGSGIVYALHLKRLGSPSCLKFVEFLFRKYSTGSVN